MSSYQDTIQIEHGDHLPNKNKEGKTSNEVQHVKVISKLPEDFFNKDDNKPSTDKHKQAVTAHRTNIVMKNLSFLSICTMRSGVKSCLVSDCVG